jgi:PAS domain S-box-containing protein
VSASTTDLLGATVLSRERSLSRLLVVDDEKELLAALCDTLPSHGYETVGFGSAREALAALAESEFDVLLTDLMMPDVDGISLLKAALEIDPRLIVVLMTGQATIDTAVGALKAGAFDYVTKPFKLAGILPTLSRAMQTRWLKLENLELLETVAIHDLVQAIAFTLDVGTIVNTVTDAALQQCEADEASLMLPTEDGLELIVAAVRGDNREYVLGQRVAIGEGVAGWVGRSQEPVLLEGAVDDPRFAPLRHRPDVVAAVSIPILSGGQLVGVLNVSTRRRRPFTIGQIKALSLFTGLAGPVLQNARLHELTLAAEAKYRSIFENCVEAIFRVAPGGQLLAANPALAQMLGYSSPAEALDRITDISTQMFAEPPICADFLSRADRGTAQGFEIQFRHASGKLVWVAASARPVSHADGSVLHYEATALDVTNRKIAEESARRSADRMAAVVKDAPVILMAVDGAGVIKFAQGKLLDALGIRAADLVGRPLLELYGDELDIVEALRRSLDGEAFSAEAHVKRFDRFFQISANPIRGSDGTIAEVIVVMVDITERREIDIAGRELEAKSRFLSMVTHELRNPLSAILGFTDLLGLPKTGPLNEVQQHYLATMRRSGDQLLALINDQLDLAKARTGHLDVASEPVPLRPVLIDAVESIRPLARSKNLALRITASEVMVVRADRRRLNQIMLNLLSNAIKFTVRGTVTVTARQKGEIVKISVRDTGIGIPKDEQARIFEEFVQLKSTVAADRPGTGLGLTLSRELAIQMGGTIEVTSQSGRGSVFTLVLPAAD